MQEETSTIQFKRAPGKAPLLAFYIDASGEIRMKEENLSQSQALALFNVAKAYCESRTEEEVTKLREGRIRPMLAA